MNMMKPALIFYCLVSPLVAFTAEASDLEWVGTRSARIQFQLPAKHVYHDTWGNLRVCLIESSKLELAACLHNNSDVSSSPYSSMSIEEYVAKRFPNAGFRSTQYKYYPLCSAGGGEYVLLLSR